MLVCWVLIFINYFPRPQPQDANPDDPSILQVSASHGFTAVKIPWSCGSPGLQFPHSSRNPAAWFCSCSHQSTTTDLQLWTSIHGPPSIDLQPWTSIRRLSSTGVHPWTSNHGPPSMDLHLQASIHELPSMDLQSQSSIHRPPPMDLQPRTCNQELSSTGLHPLRSI